MDNFELVEDLNSKVAERAIKKKEERHVLEKVAVLDNKNLNCAYKEYLYTKEDEPFYRIAHHVNITPLMDRILGRIDNFELVEHLDKEVAKGAMRKEEEHHSDSTAKTYLYTSSEGEPLYRVDHYIYVIPPDEKKI